MRLFSSSFLRRFPRLSSARADERSTAVRQIRRRLQAERLERRLALAAIPTATVTGGSGALIGQEIPLTVTFDNTATVSSDIGYGPFVDIVMPATGDAPPTPNDGISFKDGSASYNGLSLPTTVLTFDAQGKATHPFAKNLDGTSVVVTGKPGDQLVVVQLPFGSYGPDQPAADINFVGVISPLSQPNSSYPVTATGGFQFQTDSAGNPTVNVATIGSTTTDPIQPQLFRIKKTSSAPEAETATGPNFQHTYTVSMAVAPGQTVTNLQLADALPNNVQFVSLVTATGNGASTVTPVATPSTTVPGGTLTRQFNQVLGTGSDSDVVMTFSYYVPQDDSAGLDVIPLGTGGTAIATNVASATGTWTSANPNFPNPQAIASDPDDANAQHTLTARTVALQKSFTDLTNPGSPRAGDLIEYTLNFQVSDFFALETFDITDVISDGQEFDATFTPTLSYTQRAGAESYTSAPFASANVIVTVNNVAGDGTTDVVFNVSDQLATLRGSADGDLLGAAIPAGGTGGAVPVANPSGPGTRGTITFRTRVLQQYRQTPRPGADVVQGDVMSDDATTTATVLAFSNLSPTARSVSDGSSQSFTLVSGQATKSVYAVDGVLVSGTPVVTAGDAVTFRITYTLPFSSIKDYEIKDFLPLPIFAAQNLTFAGGGPSASAPATGTWSFGPTDTFSQAPISGPNPGTAIANTAANSLTWTFGTFQDVQDRPAVTDILFTVTATNRPFADGLLLTNQAEQTERNETGNVLTSNTALAQVQISEPLLDITKGVVSTTNAGGVFTPTPVAPAGVTFSQPGQPGAAFTGTVTSTGLATTPIDANLSNVLGNDLVKFCIVVENTGSGPNGAFDVAIKDLFDSTKFQVPAGGAGLNLQVTDGTGASLFYTGDLFGTGITLIDVPKHIGPGIAVDWFDSGSDLVGVWSGSVDPTLPPYTRSDPSTPPTNVLAGQAGYLFDFGSTGYGGAATLYQRVDFSQSTSFLGPDVFNFSNTNQPIVTTGDPVRFEALNGSSLVGRLVVPGGYAANSPLAGTMVLPGRSVASVFGANLATAQQMFNDGTNTVTFQALDPATVTQGALGPGKLANGTVINTGNNIAIITYDLQLLPTVVPSDVIPNTATLTNYASTEGGPNFLPPAGSADDATVTVQAPAVTKTLVGTSIVDAFNSNTQGVIGEIATFELTVDFPRGTTPSAVVVDSLPTGLAFVRMVGSPVVDPGVTFTGSAVPVVTNSGRTVTFSLGDVTNANAGTSLQGITLRYEAVVLNVSTNKVGTQLRNNAKLTWTGHTELPAAQSGPVTVIEPKLTISKSVTPTTAQASDLVTFTILVTASQTTAHNVSLSDIFPGGITYVAGSLRNTAGVVPTTLATAAGGNSFTATYTSLTPGQTSTLTFQARVNADVTAGQAITNTATEQWTSLPGDPGQITPINPNAYERTGSGSTAQGQLNNYSSSGSATVTVAQPTVAKSLVTTSIVNSTNSLTQAVIGETATYTVTMTIPQGRTPAARLIDQFGPGLAYVRTISAVNDNPAYLTVPGLSSAPVLTNNGTTATWNLGDIVNTDTDSSTAETITFTIQAVVLNVNTSTSGVQLINRAQAGWSSSSTSPLISSEPVTVIEPKLRTTKAVAVGGFGGNAGDPVTYTIVVRHSSSSETNAFDVKLNDVIPSQITGVSLTSVVDTAGNVTSANFDLVGNTLSTRGDGFLMPKDGTLTLTLTGTLAAGLTAGQKIVNTNYVRWTSLYDSPGQITPNNPNAYERTGSGSTSLGQLNNYSATGSASFTVNTADLAVVKTVSNATPNVGDTITFTVTLSNLGPNAAHEVEVTDQFPTTGLQLLTATPSQGTYSQATGIWDVGTVLTGSGNAKTLTITALVLAPAVNTIPLAQTNVATVTNSAEPDPNPGNNSDSATETPKYADLGVKKTTNNVSPGVGQQVTYTVSLFNLGTSAATNVRVTDTLPANVAFVSATPSAGTYDPATGIWSIPTVPTSAGVATPLTLSLTVQALAVGTGFNVVTITGSDVWDPNNRNNTAKTPTSPVEADLVVSKTVNDARPNVGDNVTFTITLDNDGPSTAADVVVNDLLPAGLAYVSHTTSTGTYVSGTGAWTVGSVPANTSNTLTIVATVLAPTSGPAPTRTNTASATSSTPDPNPDNNTDSDTVTPLQADLAVFKVVDDPNPNVGDTITFTIEVDNFGPDAATQVVVNDQLPTGLTLVSAMASQGAYGTGGVWNVGTVAAGGSATLTVTATIDPPSSPGIPPAVTNTATVSGREYDPDTSNNTDSATETPQYADLAVTKVVSDATPNVGDTITFTITLSNLGRDTATNVTVLDQLPAGLQFVSATVNEGSYDSGTGIWTVGTVDTLFERTLQIDALVLPPGSGVPQSATNTASIRTSDQYDPDPSNNTDSVTETPQYADLAVEKIVSDPRPNVGGQVTFTVTVRNLGIDAATGVTIADPLPAGLTFVSASPTAGTNYSPATGVWQIDTLPAGGTKTLSIVAAVPGPGSFTNVAAVSSSDQFDPDHTNDRDTSTISTREADLAVAKTVSNPTPNVGDTITFTITVSNLGTDSANNVEITDSFPAAGLQLLSAVPSQGTFNAGTGVWTVGTVDVGPASVKTLMITARVLAPAVNTIPPARTNVATVTKADEYDPNPGNNTGTATETPLYADLGVKKTTNNVQPNVGETVTYTVSLFNLGTAAATNVEVTDALPANVSFISATPASGTRFEESPTGGIWSVPTIAPGQTIVLTLTVEAVNTSVAFNTATITHSDVWDPNNRNNTARTPTDPQEADLIVSKTVDDTAPNVGDNVTFTVTLENVGPSTAQAVSVTDLLPAGLQLVSATPSVGTYAAGSGVWSVGAITAGTTDTLLIVATVLGPSSGPAQPLTNTATATSTTPDPNPDNNTDQSTLTPKSADLAVFKTVDESEPSIGELVTFQIVVANYGPDTATSVIVNDPLPSGLEFVSASVSQGAFVVGTGIWTVGTVTTADTPTLSITAKVVRQTGGTETNTATVSGREYDPDPSNNTDSVDVEVQSSGVIVGTDIGCITGPFVRVIDPDTGADRIIPFFAYEPSFRGGVRVYGADVTGDSIPEIITACGPGRPAEIRVFSETGTPLPEYSFFPFGPNYRGGLEISAGSITGAGEIQIVASQSRGGTVRVFDVTPGTAAPVASAPVRELKPFGSKYRGGVFVDTADLGTFSGPTRVSESPDGIMELVAGSGAGIRATVDVYNGVPNPPVLVNRFNPMQASYKRGVSVARLPSSMTGVADKILVSSGSRGGSLVETYSGLSQSREAVFAAYPGSRASIFSAAISDNQIFGVEGEFGRINGVRKFRSTSGLAAETLPQSTMAYPR